MYLQVNGGIRGGRAKRNYNLKWQQKLDVGFHSEIFLIGLVASFSRIFCGSFGSPEKGQGLCCCCWW